MKGGENITFPTAIFSAGNLKFYPTFHAEDRATFRMRICGGYVTYHTHFLCRNGTFCQQKMCSTYDISCCITSAISLTKFSFNNIILTCHTNKNNAQETAIVKLIS